MGWKVRNTGTAVWDTATVEFTYLSGTRMYQSALVGLETSVAPDETIALVADLMSPKKPRRYTTVWTLRRGSVDFCHVSLTINVP